MAILAPQLAASRRQRVSVFDPLLPVALAESVICDCESSTLTVIIGWRRMAAPPIVEGVIMARRGMLLSFVVAALSVNNAVALSMPSPLLAID
jgi:hypothetical protein